MQKATLRYTWVCVLLLLPADRRIARVTLPQRVTNLPWHDVCARVCRCIARHLQDESSTFSVSPPPAQGRQAHVRAAASFPSTAPKEVVRNPLTAQSRQQGASFQVEEADFGSVDVESMPVPISSPAKTSRHRAIAKWLLQHDTKALFGISLGVVFAQLLVAVLNTTTFKHQGNCTTSDQTTDPQCLAGQYDMAEIRAILGFFLGSEDSIPTNLINGAFPFLPFYLAFPQAFIRQRWKYIAITFTVLEGLVYHRFSNNIFPL
jgi:hypothetical protein